MLKCLDAVGKKRANLDEFSPDFFVKKRLSSGPQGPAKVPTLGPLHDDHKIVSLHKKIRR